MACKEYLYFGNLKGNLILDPAVPGNKSLPLLQFSGKFEYFV